MSLNNTAHETSSSLEQVRNPEPFFSTPPTAGADNRRQPINVRGFADLPGIALPQDDLFAPPQQPQIRSITELTYGTPEPPDADAPADLLPSAPRAPVEDTSLYFWRATAALLITVPGHSGTFVSTGWFIGPYAVITAAHAVYPRKQGGHTGWVSRVEVVPGMDGFDGARPFGSAFSQNFQCPIAWQNHGAEAQDYAVVLLSQGLGLTVGTYGFATYSSNDIMSSLAHLAGYPVVPPQGAGPHGRQWYGVGSVTGVDDSFVYHNLGTILGDSGSCLHRLIGEQPHAMAIHTSAANVGRGIRITPPVYANLQMWAGMRG